MSRIRAGFAAALLVLAGLAVTATPAAAAASGTFTALSYNVAGLPEGLSSAPTPRATATTAIGQRLAPYDVIHVQEDFNYHANLYAADTHAYRTPTSGGAGIGSGLNTLSSYPYDGDDFERVGWNSCQIDSGDCLTPKGFTFMRQRLAEGVYVDLYNIHTNAGTNSGDLSSRADNLNQLTAFIAAHSAGNAVIVMGDSNTRYTRAGDTIAEFTAANGLTDAWVKIERAGVPPVKGTDALVCDEAAVTDTCEVVDKVLYRGSKFITLTATDYHNENAGFLETGTGLMLSDHMPISTKFSWSTNAAFAMSEQFGGPHGGYYSDIDKVPAAGRASSVSLRAGSRVDQIGLTLSTGVVLAHGGTGGTAKSLTLASTEYVTAVKLCQGKYSNTTRIFYVQFTTSAGNTLAGGTTTSDCVTRTAPSGWQVAGFQGRAGDEVDKVGFIFTKR
ncbi:hypothetical protein BJ973_001768 [Actinoplanes tereljensis]|uniref:Jacalin-type lectin domain-containing protein n=1 Tax=Paractinoplanes tereljensis TaxID=571912 RepID=A0A919NKA5_9ACTN|nr:jacalin-like lectin [Actinoplanes tereljensis]GIF20326.1 hypothetical protein Ate02nite_30560 [Actinoplanes tereljensis]